MFFKTVAAGQSARNDRIRTVSVCCRQCSKSFRRVASAGTETAGLNTSGEQERALEDIALRVTQRSPGGKALQQWTPLQPRGQNEHTHCQAERMLVA